MFLKYQHIERLGTTETNGIELGVCYVFPKIDGTNSQLWWDDGLKAGSRNRELSLDNDNAGFFNWAIQQENIINFFLDNPYLRLYGEWLVPHTLKTYREDAWRKFYVFDVSTLAGETESLLPYEAYKPLLERYGIEFIKPLCSIINPTYEDLVKKLDANTYLIQDGKGSGEGIVIKNYYYQNKYGRQTWAKIVKTEFKEKHVSTMGHPEMLGSKMIEEDFVNKYLTKSMVEKIKANIENENNGWSSKFIPRLLQTSFYDLIKEETWNFIKENKMPLVNFKTVQHFCTNKVKEYMPELF